jgi:hypothetical protein
VITSELLEAYLACPMKRYLQSSGENCSGNKFSAWFETQKESYRRVGPARGHQKRLYLSIILSS